jgi:pimeloyl-ACP methyl ester carboxylesterase
MKSVICAFAIQLFSLTSHAQMVMQKSPETAIDYDVQTAKKQFIELAKTLGADKNLTDDDYDKLAKLEVEIIGKGETEKSDKMAAYTQIVIKLALARGMDTSGAMPTIRQWLNIYSYSPASISKAYKYPEQVSKYGDYGRYLKIGNGKINIVLLADIDSDESLYREFAEKNKDRFTMFILTMPGVNGTPPLPWPEAGHYSERHWWKSYEEAVISFIKDNKIVKPVLVGSMSSVYTAAKLAIGHPGMFSKLVLLNGLINTPMISQVNKGQWAEPQERIERVDKGWRTFLFELSINQSPVSYDVAKQRARQFSQLISASLANTKDTSKAIDLYALQANMYSKTRMQYYYQLQSADLKYEIKDLRVPTLVIPAGHDDKSPGGSSITQAYSQFEEIQNLYPGLPVSIVPFYDTRAFIAMEAPGELGDAIFSFANNQPVAGKAKLVYGNRKSAFKEVTTKIGSSSVTVNYGSPKVNGRQIWGKLVPYNDVWRAGANEATAISVSKSLKIGGKELKPGIYSFFIIPHQGDSSWTVIINKIAHQWGSFNYDEKFDVFRIEIVPSMLQNDIEELEYSFENKTQQSGYLVLKWEKIALSIKLEE